MGDEAAGWLEKEKALLSPALPGFVFHRDFVSRLDEDIQPYLPMSTARICKLRRSLLPKLAGKKRPRRNGAALGRPVVWISI